MEKKIDKLLKSYRLQTLNKLDRLEGDVWHRITVSRKEQPVGWIENILSLIFPAQYRFAPMMFAALLGIIVGFSSLQNSYNQPEAVEMLNFKIFKPQINSFDLTKTSKI